MRYSVLVLLSGSLPWSDDFVLFDSLGAYGDSSQIFYASNLSLEGQSAAEFSSTPDQSHLAVIG